MSTLSKEAFYIEPGTVAALESRARRARAQAMHSAVLRLFAYLAPRMHLRLPRIHARPARWLARLG